MMNQRTYYFDYLRVIATIAVMLTHVSAPVLFAWPIKISDNFTPFMVANFFDSLSRFAVDIFFMISGALLLDEKKKFNLKKQWFKVFIPFTLWSVIYVVVNNWRNNLGLKLYWQTSSDYKEAFMNFVGGQNVAHLWFIYALLGLYFAVPILRSVTGIQDETKKRALLRYILLLWAVFTLVFPFINRFTPFTLGIQPDFISTYLGFMVLGYYISYYDVRLPSPLCFILWLISLISMVIIIYYSRLNGDYSNWAWGNAYPPVTINALALFFWAKNSWNRAGIFYPLIKRLSPLSFQAYLAHVFILCYVSEFWPRSFPINAHGLLTIPLATFFVALFSYLLAYGLWWIAQLKKKEQQ